MISSTPLHVIHWDYTPLSRTMMLEDSYSMTPLKAIGKSNTDKKSIGFRFHHRRFKDNIVMFSYIGEVTYIIDKEDIINSEEMIKMFMSAYYKYRDYFEKRASGTPLQLSPLKLWDESKIDPISLIEILG